MHDPHGVYVVDRHEDLKKPVQDLSLVKVLLLLVLPDLRRVVVAGVVVLTVIGIVVVPYSSSFASLSRLPYPLVPRAHSLDDLR